MVGAHTGWPKRCTRKSRRVTDQPVKLVVNENGQGHAALGNCYWAKQGVKIIAHEDAAHEFEQRSHQIMQAARSPAERPCSETTA
jgi:hypothetical protein